MNIEFIIASACLALLPGPDILFVLTQSIGRGFKAAFSVSLGLVSGLAFHTAAVALGVAALVAASPVLFHILKYLGASYLFWLGISAVRASRSGSAQSAPSAALSAESYSFARFYRRGVIMNLLNPKVIIFFLSFFPGFIPRETPSAGWAVAGLGVTFAAVTLCVFTLVCVLGGWLNKRFHIARYASGRAFAWITAGIFGVIGAWIACT